MRGFFVLFLMVGSILFLVSTGLTSDSRVVARIGDRVVTEADLEARADMLPGLQKKMVEFDPNGKKELLEILVKEIVLSDLARSEGMDKDEKVKREIQFVVDQFLATLYMKEKVLKGIKITDQDLEQYYNSHPEEFTLPKRARMRDIFIMVKKGAPEDERMEKRRLAEEILKRIRAGEDFAKLAEEYSDDQRSKDKGGDIGYIYMNKRLPSYLKEAFSLGPGEVSDVLEARNGYHIVKVEEKHESRLQPFEKIKEGVKLRVLQRLQDEMVKEFLDRVYKEKGVEFYLR